MYFYLHHCVMLKYNLRLGTTILQVNVSDTGKLFNFIIYNLFSHFQVDWSKEQECFHTFSMETALFFAVAPQFIDEVKIREKNI